MKIFPTFGLGFGFAFGFGFGESSVKPKEQSLWAMRWIADLGRLWVWVSEAELRIRNQVLVKKMKGTGDWSVRGFEESEKVVK